MISALFLAAAVSTPPQWEPSPEAARRILERLDDEDQRLAALERLRSDLRGWPHDVGIVVAGAAIDMLSTGAFRDDPSRGLVEGNSLIGNGPGAAEKHVALKSIGIVAVSAISYELRLHGKPKEARIMSLIIGGGFSVLGIHNWLK